MTKTILLSLAEEQADRITHWPKVRGEGLLAKVRRVGWASNWQ